MTITVPITVNGSGMDVPQGATVSDVVVRMHLPDRGVAVALDGEVVPRSQWPRTTVPAEARVEIVTAMQGG